MAIIRYSGPPRPRVFNLIFPKSKPISEKTLVGENVCGRVRGMDGVDTPAAYFPTSDGY